MMTFELTFMIETSDGSEIDLSELESILSYYGNTDLELVDLDLAEPNIASATFSMEAETIRECPKTLDILNDEEFVEDVNFYETERVSYTSY